MKWHQMNKKQWMYKARRMFLDAQSERKPCEVCGLYGDITEAHHLVPLIDQWLAGFDAPLHAHVWLCPTHHTLTHKELKTSQKQTTNKARDKEAEAVLFIVLKAKAALAICRTRFAHAKTIANNKEYTLEHYAELVGKLQHNKEPRRQCLTSSITCDFNGTRNEERVG